jgi:hypothetical protein
MGISTRDRGPEGEVLRQEEVSGKNNLLLALLMD